jgi:hypothetical protein
MAKLGRPPLKTRYQFVAAILRDATLKEAAGDAGCTVSCAQRWASQCGFRRMYVTQTERAAVLRLRQGAIAFLGGNAHA